MTKFWNGKSFTDKMPLTRAAEERAAARQRAADAVAEQPCGCADKPMTRARVRDHGLEMGDPRGFWKITKR